jgi:PST family polysaccharide transporter
MMAAEAAVPQGAQPSASHLAAKARKGTHAVLATRLVAVACTAGSIPILARILAPADFGVWAMAVVPLGLMTIVREFGLVSSVVQARTLTQEEQDGYFWTSVAVSLAAAAVLALAAPLLSRLYEEPLLSPVLWACCVSLAVSGLGLVHTALLRRALQYDKLVVVEGGGLVCSFLAGLVGAFLWRDVRALVAIHVASAVWMSATALMLYRWKPGPPRRPAIRLSFTLQVMLSNLLTFAGNNVGLVVGYRFPAAQLGFFNRGQTLFNLASFAVLTPITEVGFSLLCRLKGEAAYTHAYIALARRVAVLFIPYAVILPIVSTDLVRALLGPAWDPAAPVLAWFAPAVVAQAFAALFAQLMMSQGRGAELRNFSAVDLLMRAGGAILGSQFGVAGMAAGFSLAAFLLSVPLMAWIAGRSGPVKLRDQLSALWPGVALAAATALGAAGAVVVAERFGMSAGWARLFFIGGSGALAWLVACVVLRPAWNALLGKGVAHA